MSTTKPAEIVFYLRHEKFGFLSNFYRAQQRVDNKFYKTNENFYQSKKAADPTVEWWIANAPTPFLAMMAGRSLRKGMELKEGWEATRTAVMLTGLRAKFSQNNILRANLLGTGELPIHEESDHPFWGRKGEDQLGKLLVQVRAEMRRG